MIGRMNQTENTVRIYTTLALKMLDRSCRSNDKPVLPAFRLWLILRSITTSGKVTPAQLFQATKYSISKRYVQTLLARGEGVFWTRAKNSKGVTYIWSTSTVKLAAKFATGRFMGEPVQIPISMLFGSHKRFSAALAATFDASRDSKPITRKTKQEIIHRSPNTQRSYEKAVGTAVTANFAILDNYTPHRLDMHRKGEHVPAFELVDVDGRFSEPGQAHVARRIANTYEAAPTHQPIKSAANKRLNKQLSSLCFMVDKGTSIVDRVYYDDADKGDMVSGAGYWLKNKSTNSGIWVMK